MKKISLIITTIVIITFISSCTKKENNSQFNIENQINSDNYVSEKEISVVDKHGNILKFDKKLDVVSSLEQYNKMEFPLIAKVDSENIFLYEYKGKGVILVKNNSVQYLELGKLGYITPRGILPEMFYDDFDSDGDNEIAINLYVGSGTGVSFEELHIIEEVEKEEGIVFTVSSLDNLAYVNEIRKKIKYTINQSANSITINFDEKEYLFGTMDDVESLGYGSLANFQIIDGTIKLVMPIGVVKKNSVSLQDVEMGSIICNVIYRDNKFIIDNMVISDEITDPIGNKPILN